MTNVAKLKFIKKHASEIMDKLRDKCPIANEWYATKREHVAIVEFIDSLHNKLAQHFVLHTYEYDNVNYEFEMKYFLNYSWLSDACPALDIKKNQLQARFNDLNHTLYNYVNKEYNKLLMKAETGKLTDKEFDEIYNKIMEDDNDK